MSFSLPRVLTRAGMAAAAAALPGAGLAAAPASAVLPTPSTVDTGASAWITYATEADRAWVHLPALAVSPALEQVAHQHAAAMAAGDTLFDSPDLVQAAGWAAPGWTGLAENSGYGATAPAVAWALVHSPSHLANILGHYDEVGVAVVNSGATLWVAEVFAEQG